MQGTVDPSPGAAPVVRVERWPGERLLYGLVLGISLVTWVLITLSIVGLIYGVILGFVFFLGHLMMIAHLRGSAVRLGPEQMPELYRRVEQIAKQLGMHEVPDAYVLQHGGSLNAFATKFFGTSFIVLFSDLLEACEDNEEARDFIIAHELGHLAAGHLRRRWLILPGLLVPFLGTAYSRACEYTSDRYGIAVATDRDRALTGLTILAAGPKHGPHVNRRALVAQRADIETVWMKIGHWLSTHPAIAERLAELQPELVDGRLHSTAGLRAGLALASMALLPVFGAIALGSLFVSSMDLFSKVQSAQQDSVATAGMFPADLDGVDVPDAPALDEAAASAQVERDILALVDTVEAHRESAGQVPADVQQLYQLHAQAHPGAPELRDPFDGEAYGYRVLPGDRFMIYSLGPDPDDDADDLYYLEPAPEAEGQDAPAQ